MLHNRGVCLSYVDRLDEAKTDMIAALELHKHDVSFIQLGKFHLMGGNVHDAIAVYVNKPPCMRFFLLRVYTLPVRGVCVGRAGSSVGSPPPPLVWFHNLNPTSLSPPSSQHNCQLTSTQLHAAPTPRCRPNLINSYLEALIYSPENSELFTTLGLLYLQIGDTPKAFDFFGRAMTYDARDPTAILGAGSVIQQCDDFDVALVSTSSALPEPHEYKHGGCIDPIDA